MKSLCFPVAVIAFWAYIKAKDLCLGAYSERGCGSGGGEVPRIAPVQEQMLSRGLPALTEALTQKSPIVFIFCDQAAIKAGRNYRGIRYSSHDAPDSPENAFFCPSSFSKFHPLTTMVFFWKATQKLMKRVKNSGNLLSLASILYF